MSIQPHPDVEALREQCRSKRLRLSAVLDELHRMSDEVRPQLTELYDRYFGSQERELQRLAIACADIARRVELLMVKIARGETITTRTIELVNAVVDKEFARFRERLRRAFDMTAEDRNEAERLRGDGPPDGEIVRMYRTLAKKLHPDTGQAPSASAQQWHRLQQAYRDRNLYQLRALLDSVGAEAPEDDVCMMNLDVLRREADRLDARLRMEDRKLQRMRAEEPFVIAQDLTNEVWLKKHLRELETSIDARNKELKEHHDHYREITGGEAVPGSSGKDDEATAFDKDFMANTYMGQR